LGKVGERDAEGREVEGGSELLYVGDNVLLGGENTPPSGRPKAPKEIAEGNRERNAITVGAMNGKILPRCRYAFRSVRKSSTCCWPSTWRPEGWLPVKAKELIESTEPA
jgi:hypothetical protein